jgi:mannose-6-phosphate isomerase
VVSGVGAAYERRPLSQLLKQLPELVGTIQVQQLHGSKLPFLMKLLSVGRPLSLQVHPNKQQAVELHQKYPKLYPDDNHKPEIAIALSDFEALCGFAPYNHLLDGILRLKAVRTLIGERLHNELQVADTEAQQERAWKQLLLILLQTNGDQMQSVLQSVATQFEQELSEDLHSESPLSNDQKRLFLRVSRLHPSDGGCLLMLALNYIRMTAGQVLSVRAGMPHCYLSGDCVELMACSDNTIRAGLTDKHVDVESLVRCIQITTTTREQLLLPGQQIDEYTKRWSPIGAEFAIDVLRINECPEYRLPARPSGSYLLVLSGQARVNDVQLTPGYVCFVPAETTLRITFVRPELRVYRAFTAMPSNSL